MLGQAGNGGLQVQITADDEGPLLAIIMWVMMTMMVLSVIFRLVIKLGIRGSLKSDDYAVCAALIFGLAEVIVLSTAVGDGLGVRMGLLGPSALKTFEKKTYAAELLFILSTAAAKMSVIALLGQLAVESGQRLMTIILQAIVVALAISAVFALAFQCGASAPWDITNGQCINKFDFWVAIGVVDIITEICIIVIPIIMMLPVRLSLSKKAAVIIAFSFRVCVPILIIVRLVYLHKFLSETDISQGYISSGLVTQILISVAITTACVPALKPFLDTFQSGALSAGVGNRTTTYGAGSGYELQYSRSKMTRDPTRTTKNDSILRSLTSVTDEKDGYLDITAMANKDERNKYEGGSLWSGKSDEMIIKRTDAWTVESEKDASMNQKIGRPQTGIDMDMDV